jgi:hypothetical protein
MEYTVKEKDNGSIEWYYGDKLHKENGPAVELADGTKEWWVDGERHREDGAAIEFSNGKKKWFLDGKCLDEEDFNEAIKAKNAPPEPEVEPERFSYSVEEIKDWFSDFSSVVISPKAGSIRWEDEETKVEIWKLLQELEHEKNGIHAFVNEKIVDDFLETEKKENKISISNVFSFFCFLILFVASAIFLINRFYLPN